MLQLIATPAGRGCLGGRAEPVWLPQKGRGVFTLLLVMHSPCLPTPGTPLTLPSANSAHYSEWVNYLENKVNSLCGDSELHRFPEGSGLATGGGE